MPPPTVSEEPSRRPRTASAASLTEALARLRPPPGPARAAVAAALPASPLTRSEDAARLLAAAAAYHVSRTLAALRATATAAAAPLWPRRSADAEAAARRAGEAPTPLPRAVAALLQAGADRERALDVRGAIAAYEAAAAATAPPRADALAKASKAWSDAAYLDDLGVEPLTPAAKAALHARALDLCAAARAADPAAGLPHAACCVARGRLALVSDSRTKAHLAAAARADAVAAVAKAPDCDVAHHLMARWHFEMARLPRAVRAIVRVLYGASLEPGSFDAATAHYARAVELAPGRLIHRVELGRSLAKAGRYSEATAQLEAALTLPVDDVNAHLQRADAEIMLAALRGPNPARAWAGGDDAANLAAAAREAGVRTGAAAPPPARSRPAWMPALPDWLPPPRPAAFGLAACGKAAAPPRPRHKRRRHGGGRVMPGAR